MQEKFVGNSNLLLPHLKYDLWFCISVTVFCILVFSYSIFAYTSDIILRGDSLIITLEQDLAVKKGELIIKYSELDNETIDTINQLKFMNTKIKCSYNTNEVFVRVSDIYYFESVDKTTFVYCEKEVYETNLRLYKVAENFKAAGFVQISKSCVLNIQTLESITPILNSRMEAKLTNGEKIHISRRYQKSIKEALNGNLK